MNSKETIRLRNLSLGYRIKGNDVKVVAHDINASLQSGELTCLIGSNGIGKSTLLRTNIDEYSDKQLARTIGVVLTTKPDVQNMSVTELVGLGRSPYTGFWGNLSEDDNRIVDEAIGMVNIGNLKHRMIQTLSDGERQKVMIAKALAQQTPVIFLDEPTAFLDYPSKVEMMQLLNRLSREADKTIFLSTHDLELALQIADTVWLMTNENIAIGTPKELSESGELSKFIERKGIVFDRETMTIKIEKQM